jgi:trehalose/maltose hydrolase-like predicted phosphorylase
MAVFGFAGVCVRDDSIAIDPKLPAGWCSVNFSLQWRGRQLEIRINQSGQRLEVTLASGDPMTIVTRGEPHELRGNKPLRVLMGSPIGTDQRAVA